MIGSALSTKRPITTTAIARSAGQGASASSSEPAAALITVAARKRRSAARSMISGASAPQPTVPTTLIATRMPPDAASETPAGCCSVCSQVAIATKTPKSRKATPLSARIAPIRHSALATSRAIVARLLPGSARRRSATSNPSAAASAISASIKQRPRDRAASAEGGPEQQRAQHSNKAAR